MTTPVFPPLPPGHTLVPNEFPLRFREHSFGAYCYGTTGCRVRYNNQYVVYHQDDQPGMSIESAGADYRARWGSGVHIFIRNFPPPAVVTWRSTGGERLEATVDIGELFRDELLLHRVPEKDLATQTVASSAEPTIFLEVNDRSIHVFMRAEVVLKEPDENNRRVRRDLMQVYSRTY